MTHKKRKARYVGTKITVRSPFRYRQVRQQTATSKDGDDVVMYLQKTPNFTVVTDHGHTFRRLRFDKGWKDFTVAHIERINLMGVRCVNRELFAQVIADNVDAAVSSMVEAIECLTR